MFRPFSSMLLFVVVVSNGSFALGSESADESNSAEDRVAESAARREAAILHKMMDSALRVTHDRYYVEDEGLPIPAAVLKEVFADIKESQDITLRWLVVEGQAMNTDHKAQNDFEKAAVKALKSGKKVYEQTTDGMFRRAGAITLENHCLKCHVPDRRSTRARTAGLLISIPIN